MKKYVSPELFTEELTKTNIMYSGNYGSDVDMDIFGKYGLKETNDEE